ncbi:cytochrome P450 [Jimgerdemannia flammicorona]|uniref:Cytochrome P450 n=1 Tax=Jimgerdemannia flammicorona TaxID=994334 RepID=A0A433Q1H7_9FUNG|nr:cytochrome P450 [Jimgerdemannia flammicorona]
MFTASRLARHTRCFLPVLRSASHQHGRTLATNAAGEIDRDPATLRAIDDLPGLASGEQLMPYMLAEPANYHLALSKVWHDIGQPPIFKMPSLQTGLPVFHTADAEVCKHIMTNSKYVDRPSTGFFEYCYKIITEGKGKHGGYQCARYMYFCPGFPHKKLTLSIITGIITRNGPDWEKHRRIANKAILHPKATAQFVNYIDTQARGVISRLRDQQVVDVNPVFSRYTFSVIMKVAFGELVSIDDDDSAASTEGRKLFDAVKAFSEVSGTLGFTSPPYEETDEMRALNRNLLDIRNFGLRLMDDRRSRAVRGEDLGFQDFASGVFMLRDDNGEMLEAEQVITDSLDLLLAGTETTSATLAFTVHQLSHRPDIMQKAYDEVAPLMRAKGDVPLNDEDLGSLPYLTAILKETMRLYPVVPINGRQSTTEDVIGDVRIPQGMIVVLHFRDIHRSERYYDRSDEWVPERWTDRKTKPNSFAWLPFGAGARSCLGLRLAMAEARIALAHLIYNFDFSSNQEEVGTAYKATLGPAGPVEIKFTARK